MAKRIYITTWGDSDWTFYASGSSDYPARENGLFFDPLTYDPQAVENRGVLVYVDTTTLEIGYIPFPTYQHAGIAASDTILCVTTRSDYAGPDDGRDVYTSTDQGATWSLHTNAMPYGGNWSKVIWTGTQFVAILNGVWDEATSDITKTDTGAYSADGITWTAFTFPINAYWYDVAYNPTDGYYFVYQDRYNLATEYAGSRGLLASTDLITFTTVASEVDWGSESLYTVGTGVDGLLYQVSSVGMEAPSTSALFPIGATNPVYVPGLGGNFVSNGSVDLNFFKSHTLNSVNDTTYDFAGINYSADGYSTFASISASSLANDEAGVSTGFASVGAYFNDAFALNTINTEYWDAVPRLGFWDGEKFILVSGHAIMWATAPADTWHCKLIDPDIQENWGLYDAVKFPQFGPSPLQAALVSMPVAGADGDLLVAEESSVSITGVVVAQGDLVVVSDASFSAAGLTGGVGFFAISEESSALISGYVPGVATLTCEEVQSFEAFGVVPALGTINIADIDPIFSAAGVIGGLGTLAVTTDDSVFTANGIIGISGYLDVIQGQYLQFFDGTVATAIPPGTISVSETQSFDATGILGTRVAVTQEQSFLAYGTVLTPNALVVTDAAPTFSAFGGATLAVVADQAFTATGKVSALGSLSVVAAKPLFSATGEVTQLGTMGVMQSSTFAAVGGGVLDVTALAPTFSAVGPAGSIGSFGVVQAASFAATGDALAVVGHLSVTQPAMYANYGDLMVAQAQSFTASDDSVSANLVAYAMNIKSAETTVYTNYDFSYIVRIGFDYYGVKPDGLYLLTGTKDNGVAIKSTFTTAETDFGTSAHKRVPQVYIDSEDKTTIQPVVDGKVGVAHPSSYKGRRTTLARGYAGKIWQVKVTNVGGAPIKVGALELLAEVTSRKI